MAHRVNYPMQNVVNCGYTGAKIGFLVGSVVATVTGIAGAKICDEEAATFSKELYNRKLSSCYLGLRLGQIFFLPTMGLIGALTGTIVGLVNELANNILRDQ
ncbi:MAG: hypothetical protein WCG10_01825 [Chlamydiota bacterium]